MLKAPKIKDTPPNKQSWLAMSRQEKDANQLAGVLARKVYRTKDYLIAVEDLKNPLNYEIYPIKDKKIILDEYQRCFTDYDCGLEHAIEVANS